MDLARRSITRLPSWWQYIKDAATARPLDAALGQGGAVSVSWSAIGLHRHLDLRFQ